MPPPKLSLSVLPELVMQFFGIARQDSFSIPDEEARAEDSGDLRDQLHRQLKARIYTLAALPASVPPRPWRMVGMRAFEGLTEVGFADSTELLLVVSDAVRSVVDCRTGELVAQDDDDDFEFDNRNLLVEGIGPLAGVKVRMGGLRGGGLLAHADGWGLRRLPLVWPDDELILSPPGQTMLWTPSDEPMKLVRLAGFDAEVRAFGFAPTGQAFVIATDSYVAIFHR